MLSPFNKLTQHIQDRLNAEERKAAIPSEAVAYLPPLDAIVEEPPPRSMQRTQWMVAAFMTVSLLAAIIGQVDIVVRGTGRLATTAPPITLMPLERSVLRELRVKPGERVTAGQVLATLDPT
ncbi:MAG TPA: hypothetical protein VK196_11310, partial [Magnetospirillum sp.]|nr:hypothetical protein [Magnetospirillum sp.]